MKSARRRLDVNLEELDRVLDGARQAPLSAADHDKLKDALHAMAAMFARGRNTQKTSAVVEPTPGEGGEQNAPPAGHGRTSASAFTGAGKVEVPHQSLRH